MLLVRQEIRVAVLVLGLHGQEAILGRGLVELLFVVRGRETGRRLAIVVQLFHRETLRQRIAGLFLLIRGWKKAIETLQVSE